MWMRNRDMGERDEKKYTYKEEEDQRINRTNVERCE
mgnify:CR=1 FL=1